MPQNVQEFEVTMRVILAVHDADGPVDLPAVEAYAKETLRVGFHDENAGNAPEGAGEDATTSMGADIVSVKPFN